MRDTKTEHKKDYAKNAEKRRAATMKKQLTLREVLHQAKSSPCLDCGVSFPFYVMDLDHREGMDKVMAVGALAKRGNLQKLIEEIVKCDPVCANCHRIRTHTRRESVS